MRTYLINDTASTDEGLAIQVDKLRNEVYHDAVLDGYNEDEAYDMAEQAVAFLMQRKSHDI